MRPPELFTTERLTLRPPRPADAEAIFRAYATDPEVTRYLTWAPHRTVEETRQFVERCRAGGTLAGNTPGSSASQRMR